MKFAVVITAGGSSARYGKNKLLEKIGEKEVILHSIEAFFPFNPCEIVVSSSKDFEQELKELLKKNNLFGIKVVPGGTTRQASVYNALKACANPDIVAIHDAARPLVKQEDIKNCLETAIKTKAAILGVRAVDTIKKTDENNKITSTPDRNCLWYVQTPQIFEYSLIMQAHKKFEGRGFSDDSGLVEALGKDVYISEGSYSNIKITTKKDIHLAQMMYVSGEINCT